MMKRCLILGGAGFLGRHLCKNLYACGYKIRLYNRSCDILGVLKKKYQGIEIIEGEFSVNEDFSMLLDGVDIVFHLISTTNPSNRDLFYDIESNVLPTVKFLEACVRSSIEKFVYFSSGGTVYGIAEYIPIDEKHLTNPISAYGIHKITAEKCIEYYGREYKLPYNILRIANPYGPGQDISLQQGVISVFFAKILMRESLQIWGDGTVVRDYIFIQDVMDAVLKIIDYKGDKNIFNIGTGKGISVNEIVHQIQEVTKEQINIQYLDNRTQDVPLNILDISLIESELIWHPKINIKQGLKRMLNSWSKSEKKFTM